MIPTREECMKLIEKYHMPRNIFEHSLLVNKIAMFLAKRLKDVGEPVDLKLVEAASLLHDIAKYKTLVDGKHGEEDYKLLMAEGCEEVAVVAKKHIFTSVLDEGPKTWEEKIVFYADKRVMHSKIVTLEEREEDLKRRYRHVIDEIIKADDAAKKIEKEIFEKIHGSPDEVFSIT